MPIPLLPILGLAAITLIAGCVEGSDTPPEKTCDSNDDPQCPKKIEPLNIPQVSMDGKKVPVTSYSPDPRSAYNDICPSNDVIALQNNIKIFPSEIGVFKFLENGNSPYALCLLNSNPRWPAGTDYLLDPHQLDSSKFDFREIGKQVSQLVGVETFISRVDTFAEVEKNVLWLPFWDGKKRAGVVEVDPSKKSVQVLWTEDLNLSSDIEYLYSSMSNDHFILHVTRLDKQSRKLIFSYAAVLDSKQKKLERLIALPESPIFPDEKTPFEKIPYAELSKYFSVYGGLQFIRDQSMSGFYQASLSTFDLPAELKMKYPEFISQTTRSTFVKFDFASGQESRTSLDIYGVNAAEVFQPTNELILVGGKTPFKGNDDGYKAMFVTPTIYFFDPKIGSLRELQELHAPVRFDSPFSVSFSKDGKQIFIKKYENKWIYEAYEYQEGDKKFHSIPYPAFPPISISDAEYEVKGLNGGIRKVKPEEVYSDLEKGIKVYQLGNADYMAVGTKPISQAFHFRLPIEKDCYEFFFDDQEATEGPYNSCLLEAGALIATNDNLLIGNTNKVFKLKIPFSGSMGNTVRNNSSYPLTPLKKYAVASGGFKGKNSLIEFTE